MDKKFNIYPYIIMINVFSVFNGCVSRRYWISFFSLCTVIIVDHKELTKEKLKRCYCGVHWISTFNFIANSVQANERYVSLLVTLNIEAKPFSFLQMETIRFSVRNARFAQYSFRCDLVPVSIALILYELKSVQWQLNEN